MSMYARSRFAPKPRRTPVAAAPRRGETIAEHDARCQDPADIVCIRITAYGFATGGMIRHDVVCFNSHHHAVALSSDVWQSMDERQQLIAGIRARFPDIDWDYSHQIIISAGRAEIWSVPEAHQPGFIPEEDATFGALIPPRRRPAPAVDEITPLPERRAVLWPES